VSEPSEAGDIRKRIEALEDHLRVLLEARLFEGDSDAAAEIAKKIAEARGQLASGAAAAASSILTGAEEALIERTYKRGTCWRVRNVHQIPLFAYFLVVLGSLIVVSENASGATLLGVPLSIVVLGAAGAVLRGLWWLYRKVTRRQYRPHFLVANLAAPVIGALLAVFAYLLLEAGLLSVGQNGESELGGAPLAQAVAFLSGYSWEWLVERVDKITAG
jgi:hypothetical protein